MPFKEVYITKTASYLPNEPVSNDEMEEYLGLIKNLIIRLQRELKKFLRLTLVRLNSYENNQRVI